jgi:hypothetical protein
LTLRSLEPLQPSVLSDHPEEAQQMGALGSYYAVVPLSDSLANAAQVLRECDKTGAVVAGSLTLVLLPTGIDVPMLLVVGGRDLAKACNESRAIALLSAEPAPKAQAAESTAASSADGESAKAEPLNGLASRAVVSAVKPLAEAEET